MRTAAQMLALMQQDLPSARVLDVTWEAVLATLSDGRVLRVPYEYDERIDLAAPHQRMVVELTADGRTLFWPAIEVALSVANLVRDAAREETRWLEPPVFVE